MDKTSQKKFYKIMDSILAQEADTHTTVATVNKPNEVIRRFIADKLDVICAKFSGSLSKCNAAAKVPRMRCLLHLIKHISQPAHKVFLRQMLPEVILSFREINKKSRDASVFLLRAMLKCWQATSSNDSTISEIGLKIIIKLIYFSIFLMLLVCFVYRLDE